MDEQLNRGPSYNNDVQAATTERHNLNSSDVVKFQEDRQQESVDTSGRRTEKRIVYLSDHNSKHRCERLYDVDHNFRIYEKMFDENGKLVTWNKFSENSGKIQESVEYSDDKIRQIKNYFYDSDMNISQVDTRDFLKQTYTVTKRNSRYEETIRFKMNNVKSINEYTLIHDNYLKCLHNGQVLEVRLCDDQGKTKDHRMYNNHNTLILSDKRSETGEHKRVLNLYNDDGTQKRTFIQFQDGKVADINWSYPS